MCRAVRVGFGVPDLVIDAIRDADQPISSLPGQPVEPIAVFRRLDLCAYRRETVESVSETSSPAFIAEA